MRCHHLTLDLIVLITCFGQTLTDHCDCDDSPGCDNIHTCYNCKYSDYLDSEDCLDSHSDVDKETCLAELTQGSRKQALYIQATKECALISRSDSCYPQYSDTVDVVFLKTCGTGCTNYTITKHENSAVIGTGHYYYTTPDDDSSECQSRCFPVTQDCTVSFADESETCTVFPNCGESCLTGTSSGVDVYRVTCNPVDCPVLSDPPNGGVNVPAGNAFGALAEYSCKQGYNLTGSSVVSCRSDGQWNDSIPSCTPIYCGIPADPEFGSVSYTDTTFGANATYTCDTGYNISEPFTRKCLANGSWEFPVPKCVPVDCGPITNLENGTVDTPEGTTFGKIATFSCDDGFVLLHDSSRVCQEDSQWSGQMPSCKALACPALSDPPNGDVNVPAGNSSGALAEYTCKQGYNLTGSSVVSCRSDGQWNDSIPSCTPVDCGIPADPEFGSVSYKDTTFGANATYTCDTGYNISEQFSRKCLANGSWEFPVPKCVPVDCGPITNLENGTVDTPEGTTFGKIASFSCDNGFVLLHDSSRVCQEDSQWSGQMPSCKALEENRMTNSLEKLYIMPCICYFNKTFVGLTEEEIIQQLIADTKIEKKKTKLAESKLISKADPRISSKMIGFVSVVVLSIIGGVILCSDIVTIRERRRALKD